MTATRAEQANFRREGMADALVLLIAHRVVVRLELVELADPIGVTQLELQAAVARFRARAEAKRPKAKAAHLKVVKPAAERRYKSEPQPCPKGCGRTFVHFGRHLGVCTGTPA